MCRVMRKPACCICGNKGADQLLGNCTADQQLFFFTTIPLLLNLKCHASSHLLWRYSSVCFRPGWKPRSQVFSYRGLYMLYISEFHINPRSVIWFLIPPISLFSRCHQTACIIGWRHCLPTPRNITTTENTDRGPISHNI